MSDDLPKPRTVDVSGRVVGIYEYGEPSGRPVFVLHGTPACGAGFAWADEPARVRGVRLIAPDRPGVGLSARQDAYRVCDYPEQIAALADAMSLDSFAVWGYSGGGPYAVACAAQLGPRLRHAALAQEWGVNAAAITANMTIWHGDADTMVPLAHSEALAQRVPSARMTVWPGEGHLATVAHADEILAAIAADL